MLLSKKSTLFESLKIYNHCKYKRLYARINDLANKKLKNFNEDNFYIIDISTEH